MLYKKGEKEQRGEGHRSMCSWRAEGAGWLLSSMRKQQQALCKEQVGERRLCGKAVPRKKKLQPGGGQQEVSKGNGGSVLCKSLRSMASAQPHSVGQEAVLRGYNSKKDEQTPKQRWKLLGRKKSLARARKAQVKRLCLRESRNKGMS